MNIGLKIYIICTIIYLIMGSFGIYVMFKLLKTLAQLNIYLKRKEYENR